jgi:GDP-L-fucose synthase
MSEQRELFDLRGGRVFVAGHRGMVGSAIVRHLASRNCVLITAGREEIDLLKQEATERFLISARPDIVIIAAAKVGGIHANSAFPAEFIYENLVIGTNLIHGAFRSGVQKLLFLGSSCIYPKFARQPMTEEALLTGPL